MEAITVAATSCSSPSLLSQSSCFHRHPSSVQAFNSTTTTSSSSSSLYSRCRIRPPRIVYGNHIHNPLFSSNLMSTSFLKMPNNPRFKVSAVFDRFTERAIKVVIFSQREARAMGSNMVFTSHLLLGLVAEDSSPDGFLSSGITIDKVRDAVKKVDTHASKINIDAPATDIPFSISSKRVFEASVEYSRTMGSSFIAPEHIAIALLTVGTIGNLIKSLGADANHLASLALLKIKGDLAKDGREPLATDSPATSKKMWDSLSAKKPLFTVSPKKQNDKSKLAQFCVDLTARAVEGFIDPVIGRDTEIQRIVQILCRRTKNNCVLLGEPGVGKTAMAEGLAIRIAEKETPNFLWEKRILSLDVGLLMAGAKERGELESRVTGLLTEVKKSGHKLYPDFNFESD